MTIDKIAIWVHPLWSNKDLGEKLIKFWQKNIKQFSEDPNFAFVLTGCPENRCDCEAWGKRLFPLIDSLPQLFEDRYLRWKENFIEGHNSEHIELLRAKFNLPEMLYADLKIPTKKLFREARVDGLIPGSDYCVGDQCRNIRWLVDTFGVKYWRNLS